MYGRRNIALPSPDWNRDFSSILKARVKFLSQTCVTVTGTVSSISIRTTCDDFHAHFLGAEILGCFSLKPILFDQNMSLFSEGRNDKHFIEKNIRIRIFYVFLQLCLPSEGRHNCFTLFLL